MPARKKSRSRARAKPKKGRKCKKTRMSKDAQIRELRAHVDHMNKELNVIYAKRRAAKTRRSRK